MTKFAQATTVSSEKSRAEIETTLRRYGAEHFAYATEPRRAMVGFQAMGRRVRFDIPMPDPGAREFTHTAHDMPHQQKLRTADARTKLYEQATRQRWRALALVIKAKLEAIESGISTFDEEFLAHIILPDGKTVGQHAVKAVGLAYETGATQPLLGKF